MKAVLFGGSGMIGQGVQRELCARPDVTAVVAVGRSPLEAPDAKVRSVVLKDLTDYSGVGDHFSGVDAVFFCLGVSSSGMNEADYRKVTVDLPVAAAKALHAKSPGAVFCFISGAGTDATAQGRTMWARVKGEAENALQRIGFKAVYCFRPGYIQPMDGITSKTPSYRWMYRFTTPLYPLFKGMKKVVTTTRQLGFAMVEVAQRGWPTPVLESADINAVKRAT
ncbi:MAG: NAD(P)H-binding protein [Myxococcota bacterium]|jgi:uncharacterized protein YbjT (DUF2867 family)